jgi:hypothetical protein
VNKVLVHVDALVMSILDQRWVSAGQTTWRAAGR